MFKSFEDIKAWQMAKDLTVTVYGLKCKIDYGIDTGYKNQLQRAAVSIMSNIAEGFGYGEKKMFFSLSPDRQGQRGRSEVVALYRQGNRLYRRRFVCSVNR